VSSCSLIGHRLRFRSEGALLCWECERGCGSAGFKLYESAVRARRYAQAFDREDRESIGRRPMLSLLPLALIGRARRGRDRGRDD